MYGFMAMYTRPFAVVNLHIVDGIRAILRVDFAASDHGTADAGTNDCSFGGVDAGGTAASEDGTLLVQSIPYNTEAGGKRLCSTAW